MKWSKYAVSVVAIVALAGWTNHSPVRSETRMFCAEMNPFSCFTGMHKLQGPSGGGYDGAESHNDCQACEPFIPCHSDCGFERDEDVETAHNQAVNAAAEGDVEDILEQLPSAPGYIKINQVRMSVQVLACDGKTVIANLSLTEAQLRTALAQQ